MKKILVLAILFFLNNYAYSANWMYIGEDVAKNSYYIDSSSIQKPNIKLYVFNTSVWVKTIFGKQNGYSISQMSFNCSAPRTYTKTSTKNYNNDGTISDLYQTSQYDFLNDYTSRYYGPKSNPVVPDSVGEALANAVCDN